MLNFYYLKLRKKKKKKKLRFVLFACSSLQANLYAICFMNKFFVDHIYLNFFTDFFYFQKIVKFF